MKIGSDNSIYGLFVPQTRKAPPNADQKMDVVPQPRQNTPEMKSPGQLISDFHDRLTKQQLDWADANKDGSVTKDEYLDGQARLAQANGRPYDPAQAEKHWATLDPTGKGSLDKDELDEGLRQLLPVSAGHLSADYAERLRIWRS
ncbi:hypothetical protein RHI9324_02559 [Rhizobium sp. CECT 9324]|nr:hypothetical protein RHI9324_02559 [Rhizobium sp. CECT 9324]